MFGKRTVVLWEALLSSSDISVQQYFSLCRKEFREYRIDYNLFHCCFEFGRVNPSPPKKKLPPEFRRRTRKSPRISRARPENRFPNSQTKHGGKNLGEFKINVLRDSWRRGRWRSLQTAFKQPSKGHKKLYKRWGENAIILLYNVSLSWKKSFLAFEFVRFGQSFVSKNMKKCSFYYYCYFTLYNLQKVQNVIWFWQREFLLNIVFVKLGLPKAPNFEISVALCVGAQRYKPNCIWSQKWTNE